MTGWGKYICIHEGIFPALQHPSVWAGIAGVFSSTGAELDKPYSVSCFIISAFCSLVAIFIRTPPDAQAQERHVEGEVQ